MLVGARAVHVYSRFPLLLRTSLPPCLRRKLTSSAASPKNCLQSNRECEEFLPWLQQIAGLEISSVLAVGFSKYGRSVFASKSIRAGDGILMVPYSVQITADNLPSEIRSLLVHDVGNVSKLALVLLAEQKFGQNSEWAPYISSLPSIDEMHNTIFWSEDELEMIRQSPLYQETLNQKTLIQKEFSAIRPALEHFPQIFGDIKLDNFMHACALVGSRAWGTSKGISLIPFADFLNHDGFSEAILLSDDDKEISEVIADRNYEVGEEVLIRYGNFANATLLLDFGFTVPFNIHDQVNIWMDLPSDDPLYMNKLELLQKNCLLTIMDGANGFNSSGSSFTLKEVKSASGKGKGIPQPLRAFARVLSATTPEELKAMAIEANENDGRLARRSLKNKTREIQSHRILLSRLQPMIHDHDAAIKVLGSLNSSNSTGRRVVRRQMARDLLVGEFRVLRSASAWLTNYCACLLAKSPISDTE